MFKGGYKLMVKNIYKICRYIFLIIFFVNISSTARAQPEAEITFVNNTKVALLESLFVFGCQIYQLPATNNYIQPGQTLTVFLASSMPNSLNDCPVGIGVGVPYTLFATIQGEVRLSNKHVYFDNPNNPMAVAYQGAGFITSLNIDNMTHITVTMYSPDP